MTHKPKAYLSKMNVDPSEELALRGALLFGISECARADLFIKLLLDYEVTLIHYSSRLSFSLSDAVLNMDIQATKGDDIALLTQLGELMNG